MEHFEEQLLPLPAQVISLLFYFWKQFLQNPYSFLLVLSKCSFKSLLNSNSSNVLSNNPGSIQNLKEEPLQSLLAQTTRMNRTRHSKQSLALSWKPNLNHLSNHNEDSWQWKWEKCFEWCKWEHVLWWQLRRPFYKVRWSMELGHRLLAP